MPNMQRVNLNGEEHFAIEQTFTIDTEEWNEYVLADGGRVRMKTTPIKIFKLVDSEGQPLYDGNEELQVLVRHTTTISFSA